MGFKIFLSALIFLKILFALQFTVIVKSRRELAPDIFELTFAMQTPEELIFTPGQFVTVKICDKKMPEVFRAYSIASSPTRKTEFDLVIKLVHGKTETGEEFVGRGSGYLNSLKVSDAVEMLGPSGILPFDERDDSELLLLGTGTGIAPLKSMAEYLTEIGSTKKIQLYFGVRHPEDLFYTEEFAALAQKNLNFTFVNSCSRPTENYAGTCGRLPDVLARDFPNGIPTNALAYVCGGVTSSQGIKTKLIELGLPEARIHVEGYGE